MYRINTPADVANTGRVHIDTGGGVSLDLPVSAAASQHTHTITNVTGLQAQLDALNWSTGWITVPLDAGATAGTIRVMRSAGPGTDWTTIRLESVQVAAGTGSAFLATLPLGFRHTGEHYFYADGRSAALASQIGMYLGSRVAWMQIQDGSNAHPADPISGEYSWRSPDARPTI